MRFARLIGAVLVSVPAFAWACGALGPNAHVGPVLSVDEAAGSFTVLDAETRAPVTFAADQALLEQAKEADGRVVVDFEQRGDTLHAKGIR